MRSKDGLTKIATSFMAEPTTSWNMLRDAVIQAKRGKISKAQATRTVGAFVLSVVLNTMLQSIVTAARDDDDKKTYLEKYVGDLAGNFTDSINPIGMIPFVRDIQSIFQGYDVERADMALFGDLYQAFNQLDNDKKQFFKKSRLYQAQ